MKWFKLGSNNKGSVFLTTMVCVFLMSLTGGYLYQASAGNSHFMNQLQRSTQAQMLADAGLARALSTIRANWASISSSGNFPLTSLGPGTYDASVTTVSGRHLVTCVGTVQGVQRTVSAELSPPIGSALNYVFAAGGNAQIDSGTGQSPGTIVGDIYAAGNAVLDGPSSGGQLVVTGNVYSNGTTSSTSSVSVSGSQNSSWPQTESFPTVDFSYYQAIASAGGQYFNSDKTYGSGAIPSNPAGGVIYVNGNVTIQGTQNTTACIIATGNIQISKTGSTYPRVTVNQYSNYPALMTQTGNITFSSSGNGGAYLNTTGLVYAAGNLQLSSGNHDTFSFTGAILARGNIETTGLTAQNSTTVTYAQQNPPGFTDTGSPNMTIRSYNL